VFRSEHKSPVVCSTTHPVLLAQDEIERERFLKSAQLREHQGEDESETGRWDVSGEGDASNRGG